MDFMIEVDEEGRLACTLVDDAATVTLVAPDPRSAADDLDAALADARESGYGECVWQLTDGDYKWLFRRHDERTEVVVLWSSGTLTGWQHVFRSDIDASELDRHAAEALEWVRSR